MTPRMIAAALALSLLAGSHPLQRDFPVYPAPFSHQALRQTGLEESQQARQQLLDSLTSGLEETARQDLADDSTGAAELSLAAAKAGGAALVAGDYTPAEVVAKFPTVIWNSRTRNLNPADTTHRASKLRFKPLASGEWSYLKMDSTLRGNWVDLIRIRASLLSPDLIVIAPANPKQGRVTRDGVQGFWAEGKFTPLHETDYREQIDPRLASTGSSLSRYIKETMSRDVLLLGMDLLDAGPGEVAHRLSQLEAGTYVVADALEAKHLQVLAEAVRRSGRSALCCGAASFYEALVPSSEQVGRPWVEQWSASRGQRKRVLILAGSNHPITQQQVKAAEERFPGDVQVLSVSPADLFRKETRKKAVEELVDSVRRAWASARVVVLRLEPPVLLLPGQNEMDAVADFLRRFLSEQIIRNQLGLLAIFGGDTLDAALQALHAGFVARAEVAPQIPYGDLVLEDGSVLPMISKSGGFGGPDFLVRLLKEVPGFNRPRLAITLGDPAGTGSELLLRALSEHPELMEKARLLVVGDAKVLQKAQTMFEIPGPKGKKWIIRSISKPQEANFAPAVLNVLDLKNVDLGVLRKTFGTLGVAQLDEESRRHLGGAALQFLDAGIELASAGQVDGLVTLPVTKEDVALVLPEFRGHTEYLGARLGTLSGSGEVTIALIHQSLRVLHVVTHRSMEELVQDFKDPKITDRIYELIRIADEMGRRYFGIRKPRIGVLGFNPHAGEGGLLGKEDHERIQPAIDRALQNGIRVAQEPIPADTAFTPGIRKHYDFIIAMYHDQGHAPFKALAGFEGINFTGNLKKVRTTPDHGTDRRNAFNLARKIQPTPEGVLAAIEQAIAMIERERRSTAGLEETPIPEEGWEPTRRDFLKYLVDTWLTLEGQLLSGVELGKEVQDIPVDLRFLVSLIGGGKSQWVYGVQRDLQGVVEAWEGAVQDLAERTARKAGMRSSDSTEIEAGAGGLTDMVLSTLRDVSKVAQRQLEYLGQGRIVSRTEAVPSGSGPNYIMGRTSHGFGNREDLLDFWNGLNREVISIRERRLKELQDNPSSNRGELEGAERLLNMSRKIKENLEQFSQWPVVDQERILRQILQDRMQFLEELLRKVEAPLREAFRQRIRQRLQKNRVEEHNMQIAEERLRWNLHLGPVQIPPRAVFIALVPKEYSLERVRFVVDDWPLVVQEVRRDPALKDLELHRVEVDPFEDPIERAFAIAGQYAQPGRQLTVGIALGMLPEDKAMALYNFWPTSITTQDPRLAFSFLYIPKGSLELRWAQGRSLLPTVSAQLAAWKRKQFPGVWAVLPTVELPRELWQNFEERLQTQTGLEEAA